MRFHLRGGWAFLFGLIAACACAQVSVLTRSYDNTRVGANLAEAVLNTSNVRPGTFGKLFERPVDGQVYAQPLYAPNLTIPGKGTRNVLFVATMNDSVYAFDADNPAASTPLWQVSFLSGGVTPVPYTDVAMYKDVHPQIGIVATPVIKKTANGGVIYITAKTKESTPNGPAYVYRLHALDILTGSPMPGSPVVIQPSVASTAPDSVGGILKFDAKRHMQRPGLLLLDNVVYLAFASHTDIAPYHGWIVGYNADTLQQTSVLCLTKNTGYGGVWMSGQGLSADDQGNIYGITGNGEYSPAKSSYGDTIFKLSTAGGLSLVDHFSPFNEQLLNSADADLGSSGAVLVPGTNLLVGGGKESKIYLLDRNSLGGHRTTDDSQIVQSWMAGLGHIHGSPTFWTGPSGQLMYVWSEEDKLKAYRLSGGLFNTTPAFTSAVKAPPGMAGGILSLSANGSTAGSGILWATVPLVGDSVWETVPGIVRAFDASNLTEIWNSRMFPARDDVGYHAKFNPPIVANGKMYVAAFGPDDLSAPSKVVCYGLLPTPAVPPAAPREVSASAGNGQVQVSWSPSIGAASYKLFRGSAPGGPYSLLKQGLASPSTIDATVANGNTYYYVMKAMNAAGESPFSNGAAATPGSLTAAYKINSGNKAVGDFAADAFFSGGNTRVVATTVDVSGVLNPAPVDVYRAERFKTCTYTFGSLSAGATYLVRVHFSEIFWTSPGQRLIDVAANGQNKIVGLDVLGTTGGPYRAMVREFPVQANGSGQLVLNLKANAASPDPDPKVSGIEILSASGLPGASNLLASPGNGSITLFWNLVPGATTYSVYKGTSSTGQDPNPVATVAGPSWTDTQVANGTTYYYVIRGNSSAGQGPKSSQAFATPAAGSGFSFTLSADQVTVEPGSIGNVDATVSSSGGFSGVVTMGVTGLPVGANASFAPPSVTGSGVSTVTLSVASSVTPGTYPLVVQGTSGATTVSKSLSLVVPGPSLSPPTGLVAGGGNTQVFLSWNEVSSADSYNVYRSTSGSGPFSAVGNSLSANFRDSGLVNGTRYWYAVTSVQGTDESGLSATATAMPRSKLSIVPSADAYVQAGSSQNLNFGSAQTLVVKRASNSGTNGLNRCTYLRLDLTGVTSNPASANLSLPINSASDPDGAATTLKVFSLGNPAWAESSLTWANAPGLDRATFASLGTLVGDLPVAMSGATANIDLTAFVAANKGTVVTLQILNLSIDGTYSVFNSREAAVQPLLKLIWAVQP